MPKPMSQNRYPFGRLRAGYGALDFVTHQSWATRHSSSNGDFASSEVASLRS
jgi:hypothetical protein